jgi:PKD repeat protein
MTLIISVALGFSPAPAEGSAAASTSLTFGAHAATVPGQTERQAVEKFERDIARDLGIVRVFHRWNDTFPTGYHTWLKSRGDPIILSVRAMLSDGTHLSWADIAAAPPGSPLHNDIVRWAQDVKAYERPVLFSFNQEPELEANRANGTATDFIAAWRRIVDVFREQDVTNAQYLWVMTEWSFALPLSDRRAAAKWYPGDAHVDGLATDVYNWHRCRPGIVNAWTSLADLIEPFRIFGAAHPDKVLWLAEWGTVEDPNVPGRKAAWFQEARELFKQPAYDQFEGVSYFNKNYDTAQFQCAWAIDTSASALAAFKAMANDPFYAGTYDPDPGNQPPSAQIGSSCTELTCVLDGSDSSDPDGTIDSYEWDFGDGSTGSQMIVSHTYADAGEYTVRLTVTDDRGASDPTSVVVSVTTSTAEIHFLGGSISNTNALVHPVTVPESVTAGDGLLLFATVNNTSVTVGAPSGVGGWTLIDTASGNGIRTYLWARSASAGEAGRTVSIAVSAYSKVAVQLVAYDGTRVGSPIANHARAVETIIRPQHSTPVVASVPAGSTVISYWADKTATTTTWSPPAGPIRRGESYGTLAGRVSHLAMDGVAGPTGPYGGLVATANAADARATMWTVVLAPS